MSDSNPTVHPTNSTLIPAVFRHRTRADWGLACVAWEREDKRGYRFEDGSTRVFKDGYFHLFERVAGAVPTGLLVVGTGPMGELEPTVDHQITLWLDQYPDGFEGSAWRSKYRGVGVKRRLKRHRDAALADAAQRLATDVLEDCMTRGAFGEVRDLIVEVVAATSLVTKAQLEGLRRVAVTEALARSLVDLLHGPADTDRFTPVVLALREVGLRRPAWPLITAMLGLVHPERDVCVRPKVLDLQARRMGLKLRVGKLPRAADYGRYLNVAVAVRDVLIGCGHTPRDLLDVYDFMWLTLRPAADTALREVAMRRPETPEAEPVTEPMTEPVTKPVTQPVTETSESAAA